jgi:YD repeat-containing protein
MSCRPPVAPTGSPVWTTYTYDGLGRAVETLAADGVSRTATVYAGNTTTTTDAAGKWKKYTYNAFGALVRVTEPDPVHGNVDTTYTYDVLGRLTTVTMPRGAVTQTRTFAYDGNSRRLTQTVNPESGTVTYGYTKKVPDGFGGFIDVYDGLLHTKTDAKGQKVEYDCDAYRRLVQVRRYPTPTQEDVCQRTDLYYDVNPFGLSWGGWGRLVARQWGGPTCVGGYLFREMYSYTAAGLVIGKTLRVISGAMTAELAAEWGYDAEGKLTSVKYPDTYRENGPG